MTDISSDVGTLSTSMVGELFDFAYSTVTNYWQELLLLMLVAVVAGTVWAAARKFLGAAR